jgi:uncharacterized protein (DUF924 family)
VTDIISPQAIVAFWHEAGYDKWYTKNDAFDREIRERFLATYEAAAQGKLSDWEKDAEGALALLILLDQFPRNMFRGSARAFATDPLARAVAARAVDKGFDRAVPNDMRGFFYLPFQHSEDLADQERSLALYRAEGNENNMKYADIHADIIRKFGRFPHRNEVLGRQTSAEEQAFLDGGGFKG